jgi:hypothetical protein
MSGDDMMCIDTVCSRSDNRLLHARILDTGIHLATFFVQGIQHIPFQKETAEGIL